MVKERSYKILEQLDEYELQEPGTSATVYDRDEHELTHEQRANVVPSAVDDESDDDNEEPREQAETQGREGDAHATVTSTTDGVFANMAAKPELYLGYDDKLPNEPLPTYQDIYGPQSTSAPPYFEAAIISVGDEDELLVEGLPVGSMGVFIVNMIVSTAFQIVGYMLTFLLHSSHAARNGSLAGLGITFMNFGFYIRTHLGSSMPNDGNKHHPNDPEYDTDTPLDNAYFAYLLMVIGAGIFVKAVFDYIRVRRLQTIIESSPEQNV
ncbi:hypothetical protein IWW56_001797 [Coemansia sp. RSA 2131]|nr:hypothetical protein IWW56_001797 [Coemansia sp. RSA 2131]